jgi:hypothetical protein
MRCTLPLTTLNPQSGRFHGQEQASLAARTQRRLSGKGRVMRGIEGLVREGGHRV